MLVSKQAAFSKIISTNTSAHFLSFFYFQVTNQFMEIFRTPYFKTTLIANKTLDIRFDILHIYRIDLFSQQLHKFFFGNRIAIPVTAILGSQSKMSQIENCTFLNIPFHIIPVPSLYILSAFTKEKRMHLTCK